MSDILVLPSKLIWIKVISWFAFQFTDEYYFILSKLMAWTLQWRHNERDGVSNHQPHVCSLNRLFRRRSKETSKLRVTALCVANLPVTGEFPAQMASSAETVSIWWRTHRLWDVDVQLQTATVCDRNIDPRALHQIMPCYAEPKWISNYIHYKIWDEIAYPLSKLQRYDRNKIAQIDPKPCA